MNRLINGDEYPKIEKVKYAVVNDMVAFCDKESGIIVDRYIKTSDKKRSMRAVDGSSGYVSANDLELAYPSIHYDYMVIGNFCE